MKTFTHRQYGFTLIKIMMTLVIFSIIAIICSMALFSAIHTKRETQKHAEELVEFHLAVSLLRHDLSHIVNRPIMDADGTLRSAFYAAPHYLEFTYLKNNLGDSAENSLQRLAYYQEGDQLIRQTWANLDLTKSQIQKKIILNNIVNFRIGYLSQGQGFSESWPPNDVTEGDATIPAAIKITINLKELGNMDIIIPLAATDI